MVLESRGVPSWGAPHIRGKEAWSSNDRVEGRWMGRRRSPVSPQNRERHDAGC